MKLGFGKVGFGESRIWGELGFGKGGLGFGKTVILEKVGFW